MKIIFSMKCRRCDSVFKLPWKMINVSEYTELPYSKYKCQHKCVDLYDEQGYGIADIVGWNIEEISDKERDYLKNVL